MNDEELLHQLAHGSGSAIDTLIYKYHKLLYGYVFRMTTNEHTTADIVQETFVILYRQALKQQCPETLKPWLYKIATNLCRDYWKKASTRREVPWDWEHNSWPTDAMHPETIHFADQYADREWMMASINRLHMDHRAVIFLRFYQDLTYEQMAEALEVPVNTVKSRLYRALKQLEINLETEVAQFETVLDSDRKHPGKRGMMDER